MGEQVAISYKIKLQTIMTACTFSALVKTTDTFTM